MLVDAASSENWNSPVEQKNTPLPLVRGTNFVAYL